MLLHLKGDIHTTKINKKILDSCYLGSLLGKFIGSILFVTKSNVNTLFNWTIPHFRNCRWCKVLGDL